MLCLIKGKVTKIESNFLVIENQGLGYEVFVTKPASFVCGQEVCLELYHHKREDNEFLIGFLNGDEKEGFKLLIRVTGVGPKGALNILSKITYEKLVLAIRENNSQMIETITGVSSKIAAQIVFNLKDYLEKGNHKNNTDYIEIRDALKGLKFKIKEIDKVLPYVYRSDVSKEEILKETLLRLQNGKNF